MKELEPIGASSVSEAVTCTFGAAEVAKMIDGVACGGLGSSNGRDGRQEAMIAKEDVGQIM